MKAMLIFAMLLAGCGWYVPHYRGPALAQENWTKACPKDSTCRAALPAYTSQANGPMTIIWVCGVFGGAPGSAYYEPGWRFADWVGYSDIHSENPQVPMLCLKETNR